jgi:hypothetical protein
MTTALTPAPPGRRPVRDDDLRPTRVADDVVDEWGLQSFPASDPPSNW